MKTATIIPTATPSLLGERFWAKVERQGLDECWPWLGATNGKASGAGHGQLTVQQRRMYAHRVSWEIHNGEIPVGLLVLHSCDNPPCVNPAHLFLGTYQDNTDDMHAKGRFNSWNTPKTHCPKGHPYSGENLYVYNNQRMCRTCRSESSRAYAARKAAV